MPKTLNRYDRELRLWGKLAQVLIAVGLIATILAYTLARPDRADMQAILGLFIAGCGAYIQLLTFWTNRTVVMMHAPFAVRDAMRPLANSLLRPIQ